jgi:hypothetical protein
MLWEITCQRLGLPSFHRTHFKTGFFVILNEVKDLKVVNIDRFFASLRMTRYWYLGFCNNLYKLASTTPILYIEMVADSLKSGPGRIRKQV